MVPLYNSIRSKGERWEPKAPQKVKSISLWSVPKWREYSREDDLTALHQNKERMMSMTTIEITTKAREYREIQAMIKELEAEADALKQTMIREMDARQVDTLDAGEYTIRWNLYETSRLDSTKLKSEHADLYAAYSNKSTATRFQVN